MASVLASPLQRLGSLPLRGEPTEVGLVPLVAAVSTATRVPVEQSTPKREEGE